MSAGLPGLGLSGLFVVLCGFAMPLLRRDRRHRRWQHLFVFAVALALTAALAWVALGIVVDVFRPVVAGSGTHATSRAVFAGSILGLPVLAISLAILGALLLVPELLLWTVGTRPTPALPPVPYLGEDPGC